jgi:hypothetical protein
MFGVPAEFHQKMRVIKGGFGQKTRLKRLERGASRLQTSLISDVKEFN